MTRTLHAAMLAAFLSLLQMGAGVAVVAIYTAYLAALLVRRLIRAKVTRKQVADYTNDFLQRLSDESRHHG